MKKSAFQRISYFKWSGRRDSPAVISLTENASGPGLAVFAFRVLRPLKQKHRSGLRLPT
jgi:hypothetical protein